VKNFPDTLPRPFVRTFWETKWEFRRGKELWHVFEKTLETAGKAGFDVVAVKALIIGIETATLWLDHPRRKLAHAEADKKRKKCYPHRKKGIVGEIAYADAQHEAHALTHKTGEQYLSLIIYGFMLEKGVTKFEALEWDPFLDALGLVLIEDHHKDFIYTTDFVDGLSKQEIREIKEDDDGYNRNARERVYGALRSRIYRVRKKEEECGKRVQFLATQYFRELYATVTKHMRVRTIRNRQTSI
jgi:hypothetical protein